MRIASRILIGMASVGVLSGAPSGADEVSGAGPAAQPPRADPPVAAAAPIGFGVLCILHDETRFHGACGRPRLPPTGGCG